MRSPCSRCSLGDFYLRSETFAKQIQITRALEKVIKSGTNQAPANATKIFVGGIPNKATKGFFNRRDIAALPEIRCD